MKNLVNVPAAEFIQFHQAVNGKKLKAEFVGFDKVGNYIYQLTK